MENRKMLKETDKTKSFYAGIINRVDIVTRIRTKKLEDITINNKNEKGAATTDTIYRKGN